MAGEVAKVFGALILLSGLALLLIGAAAAVYGLVDQQEHEDEAGPGGLQEDPDRSDRNQAMLAGGIITAVTGIGAAILGIALLVLGAGRASKQMQQQLVVHQRALLEAPPVSQGPALAEPLEDDAALASVEQGTQGLSPERRNAIIAGGVAIGVLVVVLVSMGLAGDGPLSLASDPPPEELQNQTFRGSVDHTLTVMGQRYSSGVASHTFTAQDDADIVRIQVWWMPPVTGAERLYITLEQRVGDGWDLVDLTQSSQYAFLQVASATVGGSQFRVTLHPTGEGYGGSHEYTGFFSSHG